MADHFIVTGLDLWTLPVFQKAVFFVNLRLNSKHWIQNSTKQALETIIRKKNNLTIQSFCALFLLVPSKIKQESLRKKNVKIAVLLLGAPSCPGKCHCWEMEYTVCWIQILVWQSPCSTRNLLTSACIFPHHVNILGFRVACNQVMKWIIIDGGGGEKKNKSFTWTVSIINVTSQAKLSFKKPLSSSVF